MFKNPSIKSRLILVIGLLSVLLLVVGGIGLTGMIKANEGLKTVYADCVVPIGQLAEILRLSTRSRMDVTTALVTPTPDEIRKNADDIEANIALMEKISEAYMATYLTNEEEVLAKKFVEDRRNLVQRGLLPAVKALRANDLSEASRLWVEAVRPLYVTVGDGADALMKLQLDVAKSEYDQAESRYAIIRNASMVAIVFGVLLAVLMGFLLVRSILRQLGGEPADAAEAANRVAAGDLSKNIALLPGDTGSVMAAMVKMQDSLKSFVAAQQEMANEHEAGATDAMIAAEQFPGVYGQMAQSVNALAVSHIGVTMKVVDVVKRYAIGDLSVDMERLPGKKAQITEAIDGVKQSLLAVNAQIAELVEAAARGDFKVRGDVDRYQHDFRKMVEGLNRLMQVSDTGLNDVVRVLGALAKGDLTEQITNECKGTFGQLKDDSNQTVAQLTAIVRQLKDATVSINTAANEIASGNTDLSRRTEEQASSLEETASSMEELTSTVKQNADNARQANQLAIGASDVAVKGGSVVNHVVQTMSSINESSKKIVDIISVIDGIAFQTNILALNAAVEAARAGEQGRGFAVVATEVRNLAQRSAAAAKEIKELIGDSVEKVATGTRLVDEAGRTMEEIVISVKRVTDIMGEITAASQEQSAGIEQVNRAITLMDEATQQNAALVEQAAAAAESLEEQTHLLAQTVGVFRLAAPAAGDAIQPADRRERASRPANVARLPRRHTPVATKPAAARAKVAAGAEDRSEF